MKIDYRPLVFLLLSSILAVMLLMGMASCSSAYHLRKFYDKGGKLEVKKTEITIHDTLRINGKDSIIEKTIQVDCPEPKAPLTRYEIRYKYKTLRDTLELIRYKTKVEYKYRVREAKNDVKTNPIRQIKSFILWGVLIVVGLFVFNWISKR
jgi:hypothetical protein